jgi:hypothetical protein
VDCSGEYSTATTVATSTSDHRSSGRGILRRSYLAWLTSRTEHQEWLREERLKSYSTVIHKFAAAASLISSIDYDTIGPRWGELDKQRKKLDEYYDGLDEPMAIVELLGPDDIYGAMLDCQSTLVWVTGALIGWLDDDAQRTFDRKDWQEALLGFKEANKKVRSIAKEHLGVGERQE